MRFPVVLVALALVTVHGTAEARRDGNWYYGVGSEGIGPFKTFHGCNKARAKAVRAHPTADIEQCRNHVDGSMTGRLPLQRVGIGLIAGPGWTDRRAGGSTTGAASAGVEADLVLGRSWGGLQLFTGAIAADGTSAMDGPRMIAPLGIGLVATPGTERIRANLGVGGMFAFATCSGCTLGSGVRAHAGVDYWLRPSFGLSVTGVAQFISTGDYTDHGFRGPEGHAYESPRFLLRVSALFAAW